MVAFSRSQPKHCFLYDHLAAAIKWFDASRSGGFKEIQTTLVNSQHQWPKNLSHSKETFPRTACILTINPLNLVKIVSYVFYREF